MKRMIVKLRVRQVWARGDEIRLILNIFTNSIVFTKISLASKTASTTVSVNLKDWNNWVRKAHLVDSGPPQPT